VFYQGAPVPDDWVYYINGEIHIEPVNVPIGGYVFDLVATNSLYTNITASRPFNVQVTACQTGIDFSGMVGSLEDKERVWYQAGLNYNVGSLLAGVGQGPYNCGYDIVF